MGVQSAANVSETSAISEMSQERAVQIFASTSVVTISFFPSLAIEARLIPAAFQLNGATAYRKR